VTTSVVSRSRKSSQIIAAVAAGKINVSALQKRCKKTEEGR